MTSRTGDGRVGRVGRVVGSLVAVTLSVAFIGWGVHHLLAVDSGITAPVAIVDCGSPGRGGDRSCRGVWRPNVTLAPSQPPESAFWTPPDGNEKTVYFFNQSGLNVGSTVVAHIHGDRAYTTNASFNNGVAPILFGCAGLVFVIFRYLRQRIHTSRQIGP